MARGNGPLAVALVVDSMFSCSCCGSDVTAPKFYKGAVYGYSCFARITGEKVRKDKAVWVKAKRVTLNEDGGLFYAIYLFARQAHPR